ncbi:MAG: hypothetical protein OXE94_04415 [Aestuariivita sp.]|nr:hypothetical protein [Aestuariivita sp.]MCY4202722.1 hypothetical protein [Aestuariivita sp.]
MIEIAEEDFGPATKVLPCAKKYRGTKTRIVYVDDDRIHWKYFLETRLRAASVRPSECIAARGRDIDLFLRDSPNKPTNSEQHHTENNREFWNAAASIFDRQSPRVNTRRGGIKNLPSNLPFWVARKISFARQDCYPWMLYKPDCGYAHIAEGFGGVMVKPEFFGDEAFHIPPVFWAVDDVWLSGNLARSGIFIWVEQLIPKKGSRKNIISQADKVVPLHDAIIDDHNRTQANTTCIRFFQEKYGIWRTSNPAKGMLKKQ